MAAPLLQRLMGGYGELRGSFRRELASDPPEARLLFYAIFACVVIFLARLPGLMRLDRVPEAAEARPAFVAGLLIANVIFAPLMLYGISALSHLVARAAGGQGSWKSARLAMFWALLLAAGPVVLANAAVSLTGLGGSAAGAVLEMLPLPFFLWFWAVCLDEAENLHAPFAICAGLGAVPLVLIGLTRLFAVLGTGEA